MKYPLVWIAVLAFAALSSCDNKAKQENAAKVREDLRRAVAEMERRREAANTPASSPATGIDYEQSLLAVERIKAEANTLGVDADSVIQEARDSISKAREEAAVLAKKREDAYQADLARRLSALKAQSAEESRLREKKREIIERFSDIVLEKIRSGDRPSIQAAKAARDIVYAEIIECKDDTQIEQVVARATAILDESDTSVIIAD